ncbi:MAG: hypothetical protein AAF809_15915, partial [Bacteroidota bacterium]
MRLVLVALACALIGVGCKKQERLVRTLGVEDVAPLIELNLAELNLDVTFTETVSERAFVFLKSDAEIRVDASVTYKYYLDFRNDGYSMALIPADSLGDGARVLRFDAPPIRVQQPIVNRSDVTYPRRGLLVNEEAEAVEILEYLSDRLVDFGQEKLDTDPAVQNECEASLKGYLQGIMQQTGIEVADVIVTFGLVDV